jgi:HAD superfamily hydrolase (TIGR01509 family)
VDIPKGLRAAVFDFDGVIVDSEPLHFRLFQQLLAEEGIVLTRAAYDSIYLGMDDRDCFTTVLNTHGKPTSVSKVSQLIERKSALLMAEVKREVPLLPGAADLIRTLAQSVPVAICSGALRREIEAMLEQVGLVSLLVGIVSAEDVAHGKPNPEGYRAALRLVNRHPKISQAEEIHPETVLVIEDSIAGIEAGRAAGMRCLAVTNSYPMAALKRAGADAVVTTLEGNPLTDVARLFRGHS